MESFEGSGGFFEAGGFCATGVDEGEGDVFDDGEGIDEIEILEDDADSFGAEAGFFVGGELVGGGAVEEVGAGGGLVEEAEDV